MTIYNEQHYNDRKKNSVGDIGGPINSEIVTVLDKTFLLYSPRDRQEIVVKKVYNSLNIQK